MIIETDARRGKSPLGLADIVHLFTNSRDELFRGDSKNKDLIKQDGAIWVSWYKKSAKLPTRSRKTQFAKPVCPSALSM